MSGRRIPQSSRLGDLVLAIGLALLALAEIWWPGGFVATGQSRATRDVLVPTALAMTLPLALRHRWPLATVLVVFGAAALQELLSTPPDGIAGVTALLVASYSVAAYPERRPAIVGLTGALALSLSGGVGDAAFAWVLIGGAWGAGRIVRRQNLLLHALAREQEARERAAVAEERARIARELHDVVAHSVSVMVVQAEAGEALLARRSRAGRASRSSRSARPGARRSARCAGCSACCAATTAEPALAPQPGLAQLRRSGRADARRRPARRAARRGRAAAAAGRRRPLRLPDRAGGADQRAQARAARARAGDRPLRAPTTSSSRSVDDGRGRANGSDGGHGLVGMRERVRLYGGTLEAGARPRAASPCARGCPPEAARDPRPDRRRPGARARRLPRDPRGAGRHRGRRRRRRTATRRSSSRGAPARTSC